MKERQLRGVRQCNRQTNILYLASATKPQANQQATFLRSVCFCLSVTLSISIHFCPVSIDRIASGTNAATLTRRSPSLTHPSLDSDPLLGLEVEKIFGVELKVSLGRAYYNAGEMGDMRPTWHDDTSLAQSHRGEGALVGRPNARCHLNTL